MKYIILIEFIVIIIILYINYKISRKSNDADQCETKDKEIDFTKYKKKNLLTPTEYAFYMKARELFSKQNLFLYPKVRLEDYIEVCDTGKNKQSLRGRIRSRHVDFLLCDDKLHIRAAIELDDHSHDNTKAKEIDYFKDELHKSIGLQLFRVSVKKDYIEDIKHILDEVEKIK